MFLPVAVEYYPRARKFVVFFIEHARHESCVVVCMNTIKTDFRG